MLSLGIIENFLNLGLSKWGVFAIDAVAFFIVIWILYFLFSKVFAVLAKKTETQVDDDIIKILKYPLLVIVFVIFLLITIKPLGLSSNTTLILSGLAKSAILLAVSVFIYRLIGVINDHVFMKIAKRTKSSFDDQLYPVIKAILRIVVVFFVLIYLLKIWSIDITPVLAGVGVGGLALAFAAQKLIADLFGGIVIFSDKPFKVGDRVKIDNNTGIIKEVGLRSTKIENFDGNIMILPNSKIVDSCIENYYKPTSGGVLRLNLGLTYDTSSAKMAEAKKISEKILNGLEEIKEGTVEVYFTEFKDWSLNLYLVFKIRDVSKKFTVLDKINTQIKKDFEKAGIDFAFPTQTVVLDKGKK